MRRAAHDCMNASPQEARVLDPLEEMGHPLRDPNDAPASARTAGDGRVGLEGAEPHVGGRHRRQISLAAPGLLHPHNIVGRGDPAGHPPFSAPPARVRRHRPIEGCTLPCRDAQGYHSCAVRMRKQREVGRGRGHKGIAADKTTLHPIVFSRPHCLRLSKSPGTRRRRESSMWPVGKPPPFTFPGHPAPLRPKAQPAELRHPQW